MSLRAVIITGLSGAGKSQAVKVLEDDGYFCVDNLPPALLPTFMELCSKSDESVGRVAMVMDIRGGEFFKDLDMALGYLKAQDIAHEILFLEAADETLIRRFKETRRRHPFEGEGSIMEALSKERESLSDLRQRSDIILDTSNMSLAQFKEEVKGLLLQQDLDGSLLIRLVSFGFKRGVPLYADFVFDCRFLSNPYYDPALRGLTGLDREVQDFVFADETAETYLSMIYEMLKFSIPLSVAEGKSQLVAAIGCTGGRHRSVAMVERLQARLRSEGHRIVIEHRDIGWAG